MYPENDRRLKGFLWREDEQPKRKEDIFIKNKKTVRTKLAKPKPPTQNRGSNSVGILKVTDPKKGETKKGDNPIDDSKKSTVNPTTPATKGKMQKTEKKKEKSNS